MAAQNYRRTWGIVSARCGGVIAGITGIFCGLSLLANTAMASDYAHVCRTADGQYELHDGELYRSGNLNTAIPYQSLDETVLSARSGYCIANKAPGQKFGFESKSYILKFRFTNRGQDITTTAVCELTSDGLPAAYTCDEEVVTYEDRGAEAGSSQSASTHTWDHNGSRMQLRADGAKRTFVYDKPREAMQKAGARQGTILFEGQREGDTYSGTAYIFSRRCGPQSYFVSGPVADDERTVTLYGDAPVVGKSCRVEKTKSDQLVFTLNE